MAADVESGGPSGRLLELDKPPLGLNWLTRPAVMLARLGLVVVCCALLFAANGERLGGMVGKRAEAQSGVLRTEAQ